MEYSDVSVMRETYIANLEVPAISVITQQLGEPLSKVMFDSSPEPLKCLCGLTPTLKGAGDLLWRSPSDLLAGKVCIKPPLTSKHIQALTHQGILGIGVKLEQKLRNEMELERRKGLEEQEEVLRFMFDKEKREAIQRATDEQQRLFDEIMENFKSDFDEKLQQQLNAVETEVFTELSTVIDDPADEEANLPWKEKHNDVVMKAVKLLTKEFLDDLEQQKRALMAHYETIIKRMKLKCSSVLIERHMRHKDMMRQLKHYLECKNIANMMYILCTERRKCRAEREKAEHYSKKKVQHLDKKITKQRYQIKDLRKQLEDRQKKLKIREFYLIQILKQFQKFINFVLKATPTQAEFLLNIEKITRTELNIALKEESETHTADLIQPWSTSSSAATSSSEETSGLILHDHHDCFNEEDFTSEEDSEAEHPIVYYNKQMYVREDFRNMLSQGIKIAPDNLLWSRDVAKLLKVMKKSVEDDEGDLIDAHVIDEEDVERELKEERKVAVTDGEVVRQSVDDSVIQNYKTRRRSSVKSASVHFEPDYFSEFNAKFSTTMSQATEIKSAISKRFYPVPEFINHDAIGSTESKPTVLGSSDSLDLIMKTRLGRKWRRKTQKHEKELNEETQTSFIELPTITTVLKDEEQIQLEEIALKVITPKLPKKKKKRKSVLKIAEPPRTATITAVDKVRAALEEKKRTEVVDIRLPTKRRSSFKLDVKDSLIKHRRSLIPKIDEAELESDLKPLELKKSRLSMSRNSVELARESFHVKHVVKRVQESKLSLARDSLEIIRKRRSSMAVNDAMDDDNDGIEITSNLSLERGSFGMLGTSSEKLARATSKLEMARDSLEIIKKAGSKLIFNERRASTVGAVDEFRRTLMNLDDAISLGSTVREPASIMKFDNSEANKAVKMSHVEIVEVDDTRRRSKVFFYPEAEIIDPMMKVDVDAPEKIYKSKKRAKTAKQRRTDDYQQKPNQTKIVGEKNAQEHLEKPDEFMLHRINSFITLFKQNPSLARVFTSVSK